MASAIDMKITSETIESYARFMRKNRWKLAAIFIGLTVAVNVALEITPLTESTRRFLNPPLAIGVCIFYFGVQWRAFRREQDRFIS